MSTKRKNRPNTTRGSQRGRTTQGIYNNSLFMHAATSIVGNLAQVQTHSGSVYEGIFRTFSPSFDVALEYAQCVKNNQNQISDASSIAECMIFPPVHLVSITAKNVDLDFATSGNFQTDSAISARCNGSRSEERELEPWDPTGSAINGELDLELDGNANGWDANEMFNKNEKLYGVQSTFDQSLTGYTVQIEKKDTQDYKEAEEQAEKIAKEIENQANYQERIDLENGDEESRFAAVERPSDQSPDISRENTNINASNTNMSKGSSNDKHMVPSKRKSLQSGKIRSTPPPNNNNGPIPQHNAHNSNKNNNYQSMQMQQGPTQYMITPNYSHSLHGHPTNMSQTKMNGEGNLSNTSSKSMPQRGIRQYPSQASTPNSYSDNQSMGGQMSMGKQPMHMSQNHGHIPNQHMPGGLQETQPPPTSHMTVHSNMVNAPPNTVGNVIPPSQSQPPPQPQRPPRDPRREEQIQELRKFQQDFNLSTTNQQQHPPPMNQVKTPSVSPHPPQPSLTPPQQVQQQLSPMQPPPPPLQQQHSQQQQQHHSQPPQQHPPPQSQQHQSQPHSHQQQQQPQQQQTEPIAVAPTPKAAPQQMQHQEQQTYTSQPPPPQPQLQQQPQQQQPPTIIQPANTGISSIPSSTTPPQQQQQQTPPQQQILNSSNSSSDPSPTAAEKPAVKPKHVLNPSAKPFTPRSPSTPNPSRPHTPQTPGPAMTPNVYTGPHMSATGGGQITYVMPQGSFQTPPHGHGGQGRLRRGPVLGASQLQVTAATGQPLLTAAGPMPAPFLQYQQAPHPSHYPSQPYQQMVRMYPEPPPQQIQFLAQTPPSTTPSPGQPHQQFHPGQQPSPAGGGPPAFGAAHQPHFPVMCLATAPPQLVPNYYQGAQTPHHGQQFQLIMQPSHPAQ